MSADISLILNGVEEDLGQIGRLIAHDGWGMAPLHWLESRGAEQHGVTDEGFRLDPRFGDLVFRVDASTLDELYARRDDAIRLFSPLGDPVLRFTVGDQVRDIACHYHSSLLLPWDADSWAAPKLAVTLKCADPTFYDPAGVAHTFTLGGGAGAFAVPMPVPHGVGSGSIDAGLAVSYPGTWRAYPHLIRLKGPITNFVIANESIGAEIRAKAGVTIDAGDWYDIDTRYDQATVVNAAGDDKIADLEDADDLTVFYLAPHPEVSDGNNVIRVTGTGANEDTQIVLTYFVRDLGR